jgi:predicted PurR-regulated permease PerM
MRTGTFGLRTVQLAPRTGIENVFVIAARVSQILLALIVTIYALDYAEVILAPIFLGVVIGLMFSPVARIVERWGVPTWLSGLVVVLLFLILLAMIGTALAVPLSNWLDRAPAIWENLQLHVADWKSVFSSLRNLQSQVGTMMGQTGALMVKVDDNSTMESVATLGPAIVAELLLFFASIYFFIATRDQFRVAALSLCVTRRLRWRLAHFFRDVEVLISRYLLTITAVNVCLGIAVTLGLWAVGMPSPVLWGVLAVVLNYVMYVGPAIMVLILLSISLATRQGGIDIIAPPAIYLGLHFIESQFVTAQVLGVTMTMNPFLVFLSLAFWIWVWGPIGGFIAVPSLLVIYAFLRNTVPMHDHPAANA